MKIRVSLDVTQQTYCLMKNAEENEISEQLQKEFRHPVLLFSGSTNF